MPHFSHDDPGYTHSLRLTFAYDEREVRLVRVERLAARSLAAVGAPPREGQVGHWVEIRDADGEVIYHRVLHNPMRDDIEVFGDEPGAPLRRVENPVRSGEFQVRVPDLPAAHELVLQGSPRSGKRHRPARELARHGFAELRERGQAT